MGKVHKFLNHDENTIQNTDEYLLDGIPSHAFFPVFIPALYFKVVIFTLTCKHFWDE